MGLARGDASQAADRRAIDPEQFGDLRPVQPLSNHLDHGTTCAGHASFPTVEGLAHRTDRRGSRCNNALQRAIGRLELGEPEQLEQVAPRQAGQNSCHAIACVSPGHPQTKQVRQVGSLEIGVNVSDSVVDHLPQVAGQGVLQVPGVSTSSTPTPAKPGSHRRRRVRAYSTRRPRSPPSLPVADICRWVSARPNPSRPSRRPIRSTVSATRRRPPMSLAIALSFLSLQKMRRCVDPAWCDLLRPGYWKQAWLGCAEARTY